ncbi:MAG TPA: hypothetical protein VHV77_04295 [Pirellulales bacterium]|nr:hypothetical protein [Pirellulales bacterium]
MNVKSARDGHAAEQMRPAKVKITADDCRYAAGEEQRLTTKQTACHERNFASRADAIER